MIKLYDKFYVKFYNFFFQDVSNNNSCVLNIADDASSDASNDASSTQLVIICDNNKFYDTNEYVTCEDDKNYTPTKKKLLLNENYSKFQLLTK